ncbi:MULTISPECIES: DUF2147 domain-containing protein [Flavobacterium]|uniref:DUF2147 domain-containing protein n=1 Tax=Flavobacterium ranwuense TaxID=2541725 RepID=A0ABY2DQ68_9FLAO|nr:MULTISPECIES: DUF2147 domain-containing protein [Flavobacterium]TDE28550.1 DUF2147 domain-containing protein [Flavobacterium ranwuense]TDE50164.1 DUF2147 domain-containing protein [Flavobacterium sp. GT3P67]
MINKSNVLGLMLFFMTTLCVQGQGVIGKWKTIDDQTGKAKSIVEIYERSGKIYGKIIDIFDVEKKKNLCVNCPGDEKNKPVLGLVIIKGLTKDGNEYNAGKILDPTSGKLYKCFLALEGNDKLKVRGYVGVALFGRTQTWNRVK